MDRVGGREAMAAWSEQPRRAFALFVLVLATSLAVMAAVAWFGPAATASEPGPVRAGATSAPSAGNAPPADLAPVTLAAVPASQWASPNGSASPLAQTISLRVGGGAGASTTPSGCAAGPPGAAAGRSCHGGSQASLTSLEQVAPAHAGDPVTPASPGGPTLSLGAGSGGPGGTVPVSGTGWRPDETVHLSFATPCATCESDTTSVVSDAAGTFSADLSISSVSGPVGEAVGDNEVVATQGALSADAPVTVTPLAPTSAVDYTVGGDGGVDQTFAVTVGSGPLTISQSLSRVTLQPVGARSRDRGDQVESGSLNPVTVTDARGSLTGWSVTAQLASAFERSSSSRSMGLPANDLFWRPDVSLAVPAGAPGGPSGVLDEVEAGVPGALSDHQASLLCQAPAGGGGGRFDCGAGLSLQVPPGTAPGTYSATLDIVVLGL